VGPEPQPPRDGDKLQARARVNQRVRKGLLPHPNSLPCIDCGKVWNKGDSRHEYDHHLGYGADHHYDVQPVCRWCHAKRDQKKTVCIHGHEFTAANTMIRKNGTKACRTCHQRRDRVRKNAEYWREYRAKRKTSHGSI
jgi:hypothetical protein